MCGRSSHGAAPHAGPEGEPVRMARAGRRPRGGCRSTSSEPKHPPALCDDPVRVIGRLRRSRVWLFSVLSPPLPPPQRGFRILEKQLALVLGLIVGRAQWEIYCVEKKKEKTRPTQPLSICICDGNFHFLPRSTQRSSRSHPRGGRAERARAQQGIIDRHHVNGGRGASEGDRG